MTTASSVIPYLNSQLKLHFLKEIFPDPSLIIPTGKLHFFSYNLMKPNSFSLQNLLEVMPLSLVWLLMIIVSITNFSFFLFFTAKF